VPTFHFDIAAYDTKSALLRYSRLGVLFENEKYLKDDKVTSEEARAAGLELISLVIIETYHPRFHVGINGEAEESTTPAL